MRSFNITEDHEVPNNIEKISERCFRGKSEKIGRGIYRVNNTSDKIIDKILFIIHRDTLYLEIYTINPQEAISKKLSDEIRTVIEAKNEFLELITGNSVEERKKKMYDDVIRDEENPEYIKSWHS